MKSAIFAIIIAWIGCLRGFQVRGGADSVGRAATSAVVSSIFLIIVIDAIFGTARTITEEPPIITHKRVNHRHTNGIFQSL